VGLGFKPSFVGLILTFTLQVITEAVTITVKPAFKNLRVLL